MAATRPTQGGSTDTWGTEINAWLDEVLAGSTQVKVATTANITLSGTQTIDGVSVAAGDIVLVKDQSTASGNGVYVASASTWARHSLFSTAALTAGGVVRTANGTLNAGSVFVTTFKSTDTLDTTAMSWYQIGPSYLDLATEYSTTSPPVPAVGTRMFTRYRARRMPAFIGPTGVDTALQPGLFSNRVIWMQAQPNATGIATNGVVTVALSNAGTTLTASGALTPATSFYTGLVRVRATTGTTAGAGAGIRGNTAFAALSSTANLGGFFATFRFGIATSVTGSRFFAGMYNSGAAFPPASEPSAVSNVIGIGYDSGDTNFNFICHAAGSATKVDLGTNFPARTADGTNFYEVRLFAASGGGQSVYYSMERLNDGVVVNGGPITTNLPALGTILAPHINISNNAQAAAAIVDIQSFYVETDN